MLEVHATMSSLSKTGKNQAKCWHATPCHPDVNGKHQNRQRFGFLQIGQAAETDAEEAKRQLARRIIQQEQTARAVF